MGRAVDAHIRAGQPTFSLKIVRCFRYKSASIITDAQIMEKPNSPNVATFNWGLVISVLSYNACLKTHYIAIFVILAHFLLAVPSCGTIRPPIDRPGAGTQNLSCWCLRKIHAQLIEYSETLLPIANAQGRLRKLPRFVLRGEIMWETEASRLLPHRADQFSAKKAICKKRSITLNHKYMEQNISVLLHPPCKQRHLVLAVSMNHRQPQQSASSSQGLVIEPAKERKDNRERSLSNC